MGTAAPNALAVDGAPRKAVEKAAHAGAQQRRERTAVERDKRSEIQRQFRPFRRLRGHHIGWECPHRESSFMGNGRQPSAIPRF